jgi:hypothetical protein
MAMEVEMPKWRRLKLKAILARRRRQRKCPPLMLLPRLAEKFTWKTHS